MKEKIGLTFHWLGFLFSCFLLITGLYGVITLYEDEPVFRYILGSLWYFLFVFVLGTGVGWLIRRFIVGSIHFLPWISSYRSLKRLTTRSEVIKSFKKEEILPPYKIKSESITLEYECGCGDKHVLKDSYHIASASPKKFFVICDNLMMTLVKVENSPNEKAFSEWYLSADLLSKVVEELGLKYYPPKSSP